MKTVFRWVVKIGRIAPQRPLVVEVVLPSVSHWRRALANARLLGSCGFPHLLIRRSMATEERKRGYKLMALEFNEAQLTVSCIELS